MWRTWDSTHIFEVNKSISDANAEQEQEQEQEIDQEREQEQDVNQERDIDLIYQDNASGQKVRNEEAMYVTVQEGTPIFAHFAKLESVSAKGDLGILPTNRNFGNGPKIQNYGELLPDYFHLSKNFREVVQGDVHPRSPLRHEPGYFVLHIGNDNRHKFCVVSEFEAKGRKDHLSNRNTFLFSLGGTLLKGIRNKLRPSMVHGEMLSTEFTVGTVTSKRHNRQKITG
jgi:hypothetical protein